MSRLRAFASGRTDAASLGPAAPVPAEAACEPMPASRALAVADEQDDFARVIMPLLAGRRVLDVGSINHSFFDTTTRRRHSSFFRIEKAAAYVLGIDNEEEAVALARQHGHDIVFADAETFIAGERFDVVHGGDIVEHLSNPGLFLRCAHANLVEGGHLVLSTPNTFCFATAWQVFSRGTNDPKVHRQHTAYFTPTTLNELVRRHGFVLEAFHTIEIGTVGLTRGERALLAANAAATRLFPHFKRTLVGIFRRLPERTDHATRPTS